MPSIFQSPQPRKLAILPPSLPPLSFDDGDVILRAGDTEFKVHTWLLRLSSPFFETMFSLPQPDLGKSESEIPAIQMDDDPASLNFVLRSIYPVERPVISSIGHAQELLEVAKKLDVDCALQILRASLTQRAVAEPDALRSWAIAARYGLKEAEDAASMRFTPQWNYYPPKELEYVSALKYYHLLEAYRRRAGVHKC